MIALPTWQLAILIPLALIGVVVSVALAMLLWVFYRDYKEPEKYMEFLGMIEPKESKEGKP